MRRALQATGLFVTGIGNHAEIDSGTRTATTQYAGDYDDHEGRFGDLVEDAIHTFGFRRANVVLIAFDADCTTRSRITTNMNGDHTITGDADLSKPGGQKARTWDRIDKQITQWIGSIVTGHPDEECIAKPLAGLRAQAVGSSQRKTRTSSCCHPRDGRAGIPRSSRKTANEHGVASERAPLHTTRHPHAAKSRVTRATLSYEV